jgi:hypothetical protein
MKIFARIKTIAVAIVTILLAVGFTLYTSSIIETKKFPEKNNFLNRILPHAGYLQVSEITECAVFGEKIIRQIRADRKLRDIFFAELSEFMRELHRQGTRNRNQGA